MTMKLLVASLLSLLFTLSTGHIYDRKVDGTHAWKNLNLISTNTRSKSQMNIRVSHEGILAMETVIPRFKEDSIFLREITNGKTFLQLVYQNSDVIVDCDMVRDQDHVDKFIGKFFMLTESEDWKRVNLSSVIKDRLSDGGDAVVTMRQRGQPLPDDVKDVADFEALKKECKRLHSDITKGLKQKNKQLGLDSNRDIGDGLEDFIVDDDDDDNEDDSNKPVAKSRSKRSMFIYPGTNWCGKGSTASNYYDLGENIDTDKCCRAHDYCSVTIEGLSTSYNYFNYRLHTLSHCECDDQ